MFLWCAILYVSPRHTFFPSFSFTFSSLYQSNLTLCSKPPCSVASVLRLSSMAPYRFSPDDLLPCSTAQHFPTVQAIEEGLLLLLFWFFLAFTIPSRQVSKPSQWALDPFIIEVQPPSAHTHRQMFQPTHIIYYLSLSHPFHSPVVPPKFGMSLCLNVHSIQSFVDQGSRTGSTFCLL